MPRFFPSAKSKVVFAPAVANLAAPSGAEITAGTVLTVPASTVAAGLIALDNWETDGANIEVPDVASTFDKTIPGRSSAKEPSAAFYDDDAASVAIRTALAEGTAGFMIIMKMGQTTGRRCEVWPCRVNTLNDSQVHNKNEAAQFSATFAITDAPNKNAVVP